MNRWSWVLVCSLVVLGAAWLYGESPRSSSDAPNEARTKRAQNDPAKAPTKTKVPPKGQQPPPGGGSGAPGMPPIGPMSGGPGILPGSGPMPSGPGILPGSGPMPGGPGILPGSGPMPGGPGMPPGGVPIGPGGTTGPRPMGPGGPMGPPGFHDGPEREYKDLIPILVESLDDKDGEVRQSSVVALATIGTAAVKPLLDLLKNKEKEVSLRANAAYTLGLIGPQAREALPELGKLLKDDKSDGELRRRAAYAISRIVISEHSYGHGFGLPGAPSEGTSSKLKAADPGLVAPVRIKK